MVSLVDTGRADTSRSMSENGFEAAVGVGPVGGLVHAAISKAFAFG